MIRGASTVFRFDRMELRYECVLVAGPCAQNLENQYEYQSFIPIGS